MNRADVVGKSPKESECPAWRSTRFLLQTTLFLVVAVVRDNILPALEQAGVTARVRAGVSDKTMPCAIAEAMNDTVCGTTDQTDRSTDESAGSQVVRTIFASEVTTNHSRTTDGTFDSILKRCSRDVPDPSGYHGNNTYREVVQLILDAPVFRTLRISKACCDI